LEPSGWDIRIEATGSVAVLNQSFRHLRRGGQALVFGVYPRDINLSIPAFDIFLNDWTIKGSVTYRDEFAKAIRILSSGQIDVGSLVDRRISIEEVPEILQRLAKKEKLGKVHVSVAT